MIGAVETKINGRIGEQMARLINGANAVITVEVDQLVVVKVQVRISRTVYNVTGVAVASAIRKEMERLK